MSKRIAFGPTGVTNPFLYLAPSSPQLAAQDGKNQFVKNPELAMGKLDKIYQEYGEGFESLVNKVGVWYGLSVIRTPPPAGSPPTASPAEVKALDIVNTFNLSPIVVVQLINDTYPKWQSYSFTKFLSILTAAKNTFGDPNLAKDFMNKLSENLLDAQPLYTSNQLLDVVLNGLRTRNLSEYNSIILVLPFYKAARNNTEVSLKDLGKSLNSAELLTGLISDTSDESKNQRIQAKEKQKLLLESWTWYRGVLAINNLFNIKALRAAQNFMRGQTFTLDATLTKFLEALTYKRVYGELIREGLAGNKIDNSLPSPPRTNQSYNSNEKNKRFKIAQFATPGTTPAPMPFSASSSPSSIPPLSPVTNQPGAQELGQKINDLFKDVATAKSAFDVNAPRLQDVMKDIFNTGSSQDYANFIVSIDNVSSIDEVINDMQSIINVWKSKAEQLYKAYEDHLKASEAAQTSAQPGTKQSYQTTIMVQKAHYDSTLKQVMKTQTTLNILNKIKHEAKTFNDKINSYRMSQISLSSPFNMLMGLQKFVNTTTTPGTARITSTPDARSNVRANTYKLGKEIVSIMEKAANKLVGGNDPIGIAMARTSVNLRVKAEKFKEENQQWFADQMKWGVRVKVEQTKPGR